MIQFPEYKSFVINFISKQGGGKGTLIEIITKIIGQAKFLETQKPLVAHRKNKKIYFNFYKKIGV